MNVFATLKNQSRIILLACVGFFAGCSAVQTVNGGDIAKDMERTAYKIATNDSYVEELKTKRVGKTGYYYILSGGGRVLFHPQNAIIGADMSGADFVKQIISEKNGCLLYSVENRRVRIFFKQISESRYLCLSLPDEEVQASPICEETTILDAEFDENEIQTE